MTVPNKSSLATLVMRLRAVTGIQVLVCKTVLEPLSDQHRQWYVKRFEDGTSSTGTSLLFDPIEVDPEYSGLIEAIRLEARNKLDTGELGDGRRGRSGRMWGWMKNELYARHNITWLTPWEMTPWIAID